MEYDLAVIIINYKTPAMTIQCAESALADMEQRSSCIVIVDNNSADGSDQILSEWITRSQLADKVRLVLSQKNRGFSGGNNLGINTVSSRYYMLLNSDTLIRRGAIDSLLSTLSEATSIGIVSPRLEDVSGEPQISCFKFHSPISEFIDIANTGLLTRLFILFNVPCPIENEISFPEWTSFACVILSAKMIEDIGLMDEGYFLYYEDCDYSRLAKSKGWRIANNPNAHVVHFRGGSAELKHNKKLRLRLPIYYFDSRARYYKKHYGILGLFAANILWTTGRMISKFREIIQSRPRAASEKQWLDIWNKGNKRDVV